MFKRENSSIVWVCHAFRDWKKVKKKEMKKRKFLPSQVEYRTIEYDNVENVLQYSPANILDISSKTKIKDRFLKPWTVCFRLFYANCEAPPSHTISSYKISTWIWSVARQKKISKLRSSNVVLHVLRRRGSLTRQHKSLVWSLESSPF